MAKSMRAGLPLEIDKKNMWKEAAWFIAVVGALFFWLLTLVWNQGGVTSTGFVVQTLFSPVALIAGGVTLVGFTFYFWVKGKKTIDLAFGLFAGSVSGFIVWFVLSIPWSSILPRAFMTSLIFSGFCVAALVIRLADLAFRIGKIPEVDIPINILGWSSATKTDVFIGIALSLLFLLYSVHIGQAMIGIPAGVVPAAMGKPTQAFIAGMAAIPENIMIVDFPLGMLMVWGTLGIGTVFGSRGVSGKNIGLAAILVMLAAAVVLYLVPWGFNIAIAFHEAVYSTQMGLARLNMAIFFGIGAIITAFRRNGVAFLILHFSYNFIIILLGLFNIGGVALL